METKGNHDAKTFKNGVTTAVPYHLGFVRLCPPPRVRGVRMALEQLDLPVLCPESTAATEPLSTRRLFHQICGSPIRASRAIRGPAHAPRTYHPKCAN